MTLTDQHLRLLNGLSDDVLEAAVREMASPLPGGQPHTVGDWRKLVQYFDPSYVWSAYAALHDDDAVNERVEEEALDVFEAKGTT